LPSIEWAAHKLRAIRKSGRGARDANLEEAALENDPGAFCGDQASLGCALPARSSTDEYDFPFEAIHFCPPLPEVSCNAYRRRANNLSGIPALNTFGTPPRNA